MDINSMEPMAPGETSPAAHALAEAAHTLTVEANRLVAGVPPVLQTSIGDLVRSMNCYYSNLIEGHDTHPHDIDRALANDFATDPRQRDLQREALAHIHVQRLIDTGADPDIWPASAAYATWLHERFYDRLPLDLRRVTHPQTGQPLPVLSGMWRGNDVKVGYHIPPSPAQLPAFLARFDAAYRNPPLNTQRQIQALGAVHHRFLWIHPFLDGNGRVARLMSHALLKRLDIGTSLWSVARGLAREDATYKRLLMQADNARQGAYDGRGSLSEKGLVAFCQFFLDQAIDQVRFMGGLLEPRGLLARMRAHTDEEVSAGRLPKGSFAVLREIVQEGQVERGRVPELVNTGERAARLITSRLVDRGWLVADSHRAPLRLAFPVAAVERWFPSLYPVRVSPSYDQVPDQGL